jgi:Glycosyl transferases group 1
MKKVIVGSFEALQRYVSLEFWYTTCVLAADYGWGVLDSSVVPGDARALPLVLRRRFGAVPDVVLFHESYDVAANQAEALADAGARLYVRTDDLQHQRFPGMAAALRAATAVLPTYGPRLTAFFPELQDARVIWVPHAAGPDFLLPLNESPLRSVFVSGAVNDLYPLRMAMRDLVRRRPELGRLHGHPGYAGSFDHARDSRIGPGYAAAMREHLAAFTDCSRYLYVVAKHFEIPATGALLIADRAASGQLAELGFVDGVHYLSAADDLEAAVERVLDDRNREEIDAIRRRGHALIRERHTTRHRAEQIDAVCV